MRDSSPKISSEEDPKQAKKLLIRGWLIVCGIALAFVLYGFFSFFVIGYGEPPDWDFGSVEEIPGGSIYSTYPYRGETGAPEPQHVNQKPPDATTGILEKAAPPAGGIHGKRE